MTLMLSAYDCEGPGDGRDMARLLAALPRDRLRRIAVLGKTEGTATLNDFSREVAIGAARAAIVEQLGAAALARTTLVFSTGCEGVITPFGYLLVATDRAVVAEADIVTAVTNAEAPVFPGAALRPGTHVNLGGAFRPDMREADDALAARGLFWCDSLSACLSRAGDLVLPPASGALDRARVVGEIGAALAGALLGRGDAQEMTVFKSLGNAAQDICLAADALALPGLVAPYFDPKGDPIGQ